MRQFGRTTGRRFNGLGRLVDIEADLGGAHAINSRRLSRRDGEVEDSAVDEGPRSVIRMAADWPVRRFVTVTSEPMGSVRCAAVNALSLNTSPLAALRPL